MEMLVLLLPLSLAPVWIVYWRRKRQSKHLKAISSQLRLVTNIFYASSIVYVIYAFYWATDQLKYDALGISGGFLQIGVSVLLLIILIVSYWLIYFAVKAFSKSKDQKRSESIKYFLSFITVALLYIYLALFYFTGISIFSNQPLPEVYGVVYDQNNQPVEGVKITYESWHNRHGQSLKYSETGLDGVFEVSGQSTETLTILSANKAGYDFLRSEWNNKVNGNTIRETNSPTWTYHPKNNPAVYHAWKKTEAEPLYHGERYIQKFSQADVYKAINIPSLGNVLSVKFDLDPNGEPYKPENWSISLKAKDGGFIESNNEIFMNVAPETGYEPVWSKAYTKGAEGFTDEDRKKFYFRSGNNYGRMEVNYVAYYKEDIAGILRIKYWVNPNDSRNLRYDPEKQI